MGKKVCILNGSPRPNGNTKELIRRFTKGAEAAGHEVICFDLQKMAIHGCLGCCKGGKDESSPCVQKDDMETVSYTHLPQGRPVFDYLLVMWYNITTYGHFQNGRIFHETHGH